MEGLPRGPKRHRSKRGWQVDPGSADAATVIASARNAVTSAAE